MSVTPIRDTHEIRWGKCPGCGRLLYLKRLAGNLHVCQECSHHWRLTARQRIGMLADEGSFTEFDHEIATPDDPLGFADRRPYAERLEEARRATGEREALVSGTAQIGGHPVVLAVMEFSFMGGSMGGAVGELVTRAAEHAERTRHPLIVVCASGGARMQEGAVSLLQMAKTSQAFARLAEAGVFSVCVLTDPTFGGVSASFAMLGSVVVAESGALVGFAGPRVIQQTIRQELPPGFQSSDFLLEHGLVDRVVPRADLRPLLIRLLSLHAPAGSADKLAGPAIVRRLPAPDVDPWTVVQLARNAGRPTMLDYLEDAFDEFVELHGDRWFADDPAIVGGIARIGGRSVVVIGHQKGHDTKELVHRNFGMPHPEGYRKALRLFDHAERFGLPVVTLVDTPGAYPGVEAEERGQSTAIAQMIMRASLLDVPIVAVVTGEGGSGGALALATCDRLLMLENSFYSVISPEGCAAILWRTADSAIAAATALKITATDLLELGIADGVVPEPPGGAHTDPAAAAANLRRAVLEQLEELAELDEATLIATRYQRIRRVGSTEHLPEEAWSA
ncbi:acetyl-CoA carboxylase carboxyltransferase subunit alpha [Nonomuraea sp. 10N515B]|uniref:acetyl-CoA carboxylase carboxyltransferase subunit alpha n=1 Tax=Nonomuraea sp. 10N515B TaxID=3457422 RepID=UPI003FCD558A